MQELKKLLTSGGPLRPQRGERDSLNPKHRHLVQEPAKILNVAELDSRFVDHNTSWVNSK
jgi:hypothetical protein